MTSSPHSGHSHAMTLLVCSLFLATALATLAPLPPAARAAGATAAPAAASVGSLGAASGPRRVGFKVSSFNVLGSHHTRGNSRRANGVRRAGWASTWLRRHDVSLVGMSEAQRNQMRHLVERRGWQSFPHWRRSKDTQTAQSVVWRPRTWQFLRGRTYGIPFNSGATRNQPVVLLRHRGSGKQVWVVNTHLQSGRSPRDQRERRIGADRLVRQVNQLHRTPFPVLVLGDLNSHDPVFCQVSRWTTLDSPAGGAYRNGRCVPPKPKMRRIDWIFGSPRLAWSKYGLYKGPAIRRITDHTVLASRVTY